MVFDLKSSSRVICFGFFQDQFRCVEVCDLVMNLNEELELEDRYWKEVEFLLQDSEINFGFKIFQGYFFCGGLCLEVLQSCLLILIVEQGVQYLYLERINVDLIIWGLIGISDFKCVLQKLIDFYFKYKVFCFLNGIEFYFIYIGQVKQSNC